MCSTAGSPRETLGRLQPGVGLLAYTELFIPPWRARQVVSSSRELSTAQMSSLRSDSPPSPGPVQDCLHWHFPYALFLSRNEARQGHSFWLFILKIECCKATNNECRDYPFQTHFVFRYNLLKNPEVMHYFSPTAALPFSSY